MIETLANPEARREQGRRVLVTGMGTVSPLGEGCAATADGLQNERTGFREIDFFDVSRQRVQTAGICDIDTTLDGLTLTRREVSRLDRATRVLLSCTKEALDQSGLTGSREARSTPLVIGTSAAAMSEGEAYYRTAINPDSTRNGQFSRIESYQPQRQTAIVGRALGLEGPSLILSNACASGANALGHAFHLIASGREDLVLAGGYDVLTQLVFAGFDSLQALAVSGVPRPFDSKRDGLALGEGGAVFVLESEKHAAHRGASAHSEIAGYGFSTDLHHLTQPHPDGSAAVASMSQACRSAGVAPSKIGYLNSHGTGTPLNDSAEAAAILEWAGPKISADLPVSSTKSATGHLLGGAGAMEAAVCLLAMKGGWIPASLNIRTPDPCVCFDLVQEVRRTEIDCSLTNSFGFGGANASLVFRRA